MERIINWDKGMMCVWFDSPEELMEALRLLDGIKSDALPLDEIETSLEIEYVIPAETEPVSPPRRRRTVGLKTLHDCPF